MKYDKTNKEKYEKCIDLLEPICFENGDVNSLYIKALSIVKECVKWDGEYKPIFEHGYVHEKIKALNRLIEE